MLQVLYNIVFHSKIYSKEIFILSLEYCLLGPS